MIIWIQSRKLRQHAQGLSVFDEDLQSSHAQQEFPAQVTDNPEDARTWSTPRRANAVIVIGLLVFALGWISTCDSNTITEASKELHVSKEAETLATAVFLLALAFGSLFGGPISETIGRYPAYMVSSGACLAFTLGAALSPNFAAQLVFRALGGIASSPTLSMYGGSLSDILNAEERATLWPVFALSPLLGPVLSPLVGGWIETSGLDWRWSYWIALILGLATFVLAVFAMPETYGPVLSKWHARHLEKVSHDDKKLRELRQVAPVNIASSIIRPARFMLTEPVLVFLGIYLIFIYVVNFSFLSGFSFIFQETYSLSPGLSSLAFVSICVGSLVFVATIPLFNKVHDRILARQIHRDLLKAQESCHDDAAVKTSMVRPELRMLPAIVGAPLMSISLFWLAWTNYASVNPLSGYFATGVFGYALAAIFIPAYQYIIDCYEKDASSALALITCLRYTFSAGLIVATRPMYQGIGVHWTLTLMGIVATLLVPVPFWILCMGHRMRARSPVAVA